MCPRILSHIAQMGGGRRRRYYCVPLRFTYSKAVLKTRDGILLFKNPFRNTPTLNLKYRTLHTFNFLIRTCVYVFRGFTIPLAYFRIIIIFISFNVNSPKLRIFFLSENNTP
jgi:hypothetical protein